MVRFRQLLLKVQSKRIEQDSELRSWLEEATSGYQGFGVERLLRLRIIGIEQDTE